MTSTPKLRVLALCGFTQNATIYSKQLGAIRKTCKNIDFVFLEPPIVVEKADMPWNQNLSDFSSDATTDEGAQTAETTPRAWWLTKEDRMVYTRFEESLRYIHDFLSREERFDGIMGFSQGACMSAILCALLAKPGLYPSAWPDSDIPQFKFLISVGGFLPSPREPSFEGWFPLPASLHTLHVIGQGDVVVTPERSQSLIDASPTKVVHMHPGGHFTPSQARWRHFFHAYIASFAEGGSQGDVGPPSSYGPSGANTPAGPGTQTPKRPGSPSHSSTA